MNKNKFYITTAIPYVNGKPHIGHALEYFQADTIRNYHKILEEDTLLLSGADENALKNVQAAEKEGIPVQEFLDRNSKIFEDTFKKLGIELDVFQRGSDREKHWPGVQKLWNLCKKDLIKKTYEGLYCVGCESFKTEKELVDGLCSEHLIKPELVKEENWFFDLKKYESKLLNLIEKDELKIEPANKRNEIISFIKQGLEPFSVSRSKERAKGVGVPVPNDLNQVIYVWFDALAIYLTGVGFGTDENKFNKWWPADLHIIGKDINRFHTIYWPAMLLSAGLPLPKKILVHGFIRSGGQKMSKSLGNVIDPFEMIEKYGLEPLRYFLLSQIPLEEDGDFTEERFKEVYNADLANGLGNLVARVAKLCEKITISDNPTINKLVTDISTTDGKTKTQYLTAIENYKFDESLKLIWSDIRVIDGYINDYQPWKLEEQELEKVMQVAVDAIRYLNTKLEPFLPETSKIIGEQFKGKKIKSQPPLFPRI